MKRSIFAFLYVIISAAATYSQNPNLGTAGAQFLEIPVGARAASLGSAYMGLSDDISSVFWNPAGLSRLKTNSAHFSYMDWFDMFSFNAAALSLNVDNVGIFALSAIVFSMDPVEITTEREPNGTGRFYDARDIALGLTFSRFLTDRFAFGLTVKYVQQRIWNETAEGIAFDIGTQYQIDFKNLVIAMSMSNFGADLKFEGEDLLVTYDKDNELPKNRLTKAKLETDSYPLPLNFQVGVAFDIYRTEIFTLRAALDAVHPNDNDERLNFGTELNLFDRIFLRGGYRYNYDDEGLAFGAGANVPFAASRITFNYAYSVYDILPSVHRISIDFDF